MAGRTVYQANFSASQSGTIVKLNTQNLNSGLYIVSVENDNGVKQMKFIKL